MNSKRIRAFVLAAAVTALMGSGAFAQVDRAPAIEPGGAMMTPAQTTPPTVTPGESTTPSVTPAQTTTPSMTPAQTSSPSVTTTTAPRNDGIGWGWIGLLGLAGLAGLRRREAQPVDREVAYPAKRTDATTTPIGGVR